MIQSRADLKHLGLGVSSLVVCLVFCWPVQRFGFVDMNNKLSDLFNSFLVEVSGVEWK